MTVIKMLLANLKWYFLCDRKRKHLQIEKKTMKKRNKKINLLTGTQLK